MKIYVRSSSHVSEEEYLVLLSSRLETYLQSQPEVEDIGVDVEDGYLYITVVFENGYVVDNWDIDLNTLSYNLSADMNHIKAVYQEYRDASEEDAGEDY